VNPSPDRVRFTLWHETLGTLQRKVAVPTEGNVSLMHKFSWYPTYSYGIEHFDNVLCPVRGG